MAKKTTTKNLAGKNLAGKKATKTSKAAAKSAPKTTAKAAAKTKGKAASAKPAAPKKPVLSKKSSVTYKINEGDRVPKFSGATTAGTEINQDAHKTVVLYFYPKDNTPGCTLEGQDFRRLYSQFQKAGVAIVGVSQDSMKSHDKFKSKCDFPFELLSDETGDVCRAFDVIQMKSMYGRDFEGIERSTFLIQNGVIKKEWRKVKVNGHAEEVLKTLKAL